MTGVTDKPANFAYTKGIMKQRSSIILTSLLAFCAIFGLVASFVLTHEAIEVSKDPSYQPACSINPIITCSSAMTSPEATLFFGIPNSMLGIVAYTALLAVVGVLFLRSKLSAATWVAMIAASVGGLLFAGFLFVTSMFQLGVICPWCFGIWMTTPLIFFSVVQLADRSREEKQWPARVLRIISSLRQWSGFFLAVWYAVILLTILVVFWGFWSSLIS